MAQAISGGDNISANLLFLEKALAEIQEAQQRVFEMATDEEIFNALPETVTIFRGTTQAEYDSLNFGISWTLSRKQAIWFASRHGRFRCHSSPAVVLELQANKREICGFLAERNEDEVLMLPAQILSANKIGGLAVHHLPIDSA